MVADCGRVNESTELVTVDITFWERVSSGDGGRLSESEAAPTLELEYHGFYVRGVVIVGPRISAHIDCVLIVRLQVEQEARN